MKFTTLIARFPGTCKRCKQPITPGERIRYGGKGLTYHMASECPQGTGYTDDPPFAHLGNYTDPTPPTTAQLIQAGTDARQAMTPALAADIRQTFTDLLSRPISKPYDPADDTDETPTPVSGWTQQDDADYYDANRNPGAITPSAIDRQNDDQPQFVLPSFTPPARKTAPTIDADLF